MNSNYQPDDLLVISDSATLKVLMHPIRMRLLELLAQRERTVRELGEQLGRDPTRLYYHLKLLMKAGLVRNTGTRTVGNLVESSYRAVARDFDASPAVAAAGASTGALEGQVRKLLGVLTAGMIAAARRISRDRAAASAGEPATAGAGTSPESLADDPDTEPSGFGASEAFAVSLSAARLTPSALAELRERIGALIAAFDAAGRETPDDPAAAEYRLAVALYPEAGAETGTPGAGKKEELR